MDFEYTDRGDLIVDGIYTNPRHPSGCIVQLGDSWYICTNRLYSSGGEFAKALRPIMRYVHPENLEPVIHPAAIMLYSCAYREIPKEQVAVGRAIRPDEIIDFANENGLTSDDISPEFLEIKHEIYGEKYKTTCVSRQFRVNPLDTRRLVSQLKGKGIEAHADLIGLINIRVREGNCLMDKKSRARSSR